MPDSSRSCGELIEPPETITSASVRSTLSVFLASTLVTLLFRSPSPKPRSRSLTGASPPSLSSSELQRVRLASVLRGGLSGVTLVLDEPAAGLHAEEIEALLERLRAFAVAARRDAA